MTTRFVSQCARTTAKRLADAGHCDQSVRLARRERLWAWASMLMLVVAWDVANRLDQHVSLIQSESPPDTPRTR